MALIRCILCLLLVCLLASAADNSARVIKLRGISRLWIGPSDPSSFTNNGPITIIDNSDASPYPSSLTVAGVSQTITHITVVLDGISHNFTDDIDILLVAPFGTNIVLMSDCGGSANLTNIVLRFNDTSVTDLPDTTIIPEGTYRPTNYGAGDTFTPPAPTTSLTTTFNDFLGRDPNGAWLLYVRDDQGGDAGDIVRGWYIIFDY